MVDANHVDIPLSSYAFFLMILRLSILHSILSSLAFLLLLFFIIITFFSLLFVLRNSSFDYHLYVFCFVFVAFFNGYRYHIYNTVKSHIILPSFNLYLHKSLKRAHWFTAKQPKKGKRDRNQKDREIAKEREKNKSWSARWTMILYFALDFSVLVGNQASWAKRFPHQLFRKIMRHRRITVDIERNSA